MYSLRVCSGPQQTRLFCRIIGCTEILTKPPASAELISNHFSELFRGHVSVGLTGLRQNPSRARHSLGFEYIISFLTHPFRRPLGLPVAYPLDLPSFGAYSYTKELDVF